MSGDRTADGSALAELMDCWRISPAPSVKISNYFPIYVDLFRHLRGRPCVFVETGILDGGSLFMWKRWLGDDARVIGVDLNPAASKWKSSGFEIHIGDQGDPDFWRSFFAKVGDFDVLLDDGGHESFQQMVTVSEAIRAARKECLVVVEDTATSFMRDFGNPCDHSFLEFAKDATDCLVGRSFHLYENRFPPAINRASVELFRNVLDIRFFEGIVVFHVAPDRRCTAEVLRNKDPAGAPDFRYSGKRSAVIDWPSLVAAERRLITSGQARSRRQTLVSRFWAKLLGAGRAR